MDKTGTVVTLILIAFTTVYPITNYFLTNFTDGKIVIISQHGRTNSNRSGSKVPPQLVCNPFNYLNR